MNAQFYQVGDYKASGWRETWLDNEKDRWVREVYEKDCKRVLVGAGNKKYAWAACKSSWEKGNLKKKVCYWMAIEAQVIWEKPIPIPPNYKEIPPNFSAWNTFGAAADKNPITLKGLTDDLKPLQARAKWFTRDYADEMRLAKKPMETRSSAGGRPIGGNW